VKNLWDNSEDNSEMFLLEVLIRTENMHLVNLFSDRVCMFL
jgi:hypothetical protein